MNKTIIFDLDGTLTNLWPLERTTLLAMTAPTNPLAVYKLKRKLDILKQNGISDLFVLYKKAVAPKIAKNAFIKKYTRVQKLLIRNNKYKKLTLFPKKRSLEGTSKIAQFALVTGSNREETLFTLKSLGIAGLFQNNLIVTQNEVKQPKKSGAPYTYLIKKIKGTAVVLGDGSSDEIGANKTNLPFIKVESNYGEQWSKILNQANQVLSHRDDQ